MNKAMPKTKISDELQINHCIHISNGILFNQHTLQFCPQSTNIAWLHWLVSLWLIHPISQHFRPIECFGYKKQCTIIWSGRLYRVHLWDSRTKNPSSYLLLHFFPVIYPSHQRMFINWLCLAPRIRVLVIKKQNSDSDLSTLNSISGIIIN